MLASKAYPHDGVILLRPSPEVASEDAEVELLDAPDPDLERSAEESELFNDEVSAAEVVGEDVADVGEESSLLDEEVEEDESLDVGSPLRDVLEDGSDESDFAGPVVRLGVCAGPAGAMAAPVAVKAGNGVAAVPGPSVFAKPGHGTAPGVIERGAEGKYTHSCAVCARVGADLRWGGGRTGLLICQEWWALSLAARECTPVSRKRCQVDKDRMPVDDIAVSLYPCMGGWRKDWQAKLTWQVRDLLVLQLLARLVL